MSLRRAVRTAIGRWRSPAVSASPPARPKPKRVHLKDGIAFENRQITRLDLAPLDMSDYLPLSLVRPGDLGDVLAFVQRLSGVPFEALNTMTMDDCANVIEALDGWLLSENKRFMEATNKWQF